jgi:hypothetical protein
MVLYVWAYTDAGVGQGAIATLPTKTASDVREGEGAAPGEGSAVDPTVDPARPAASAAHGCKFSLCTMRFD